uniref:Protein HTATIP2 n=1 Tax=Angiostrongylus cantonensis TaxID=6313 RepID=A0A0K0CXM6_ANGCA
MFLDRLRNARPNNAYVIESFDVTALYTNVSNNSTMEAIRELLTQHEGAINMHGFKIEQLIALSKECLSCSIFRWFEKYYAQMRGLTMGQRLAPSPTIAFMSKVEAPVTDFGPLLYCRYKDIDDCFVICSTQEEIDKCFQFLSEQSEYIQFTRDKPKKNCLSFLNVQRSEESDAAETSATVVLYDVKYNHNYAEHQVVVDFDALEKHEEAFKDADIGFCALGTTRAKAGKDGFYKVDHDYVVNVAKIAKAQGVREFVLVTSAGSNEHSWFLYTKTKGETERDVGALQFDKLLIVRPGFLEGPREGC